MSLDQDRQELGDHIRELRRQVASGAPAVSPDTRVAGLAALVQAEAALLLTDTLHSAVQTLVHDGLRPLMSQMPPR